MKITPSKDYKKPLYAIGIGAAIIATSLTGCTDPKNKLEYAGEVPSEVETTETELAGDPTCDTSVTSENVELVGLEPAPDYASEETAAGDNA